MDKTILFASHDNHALYTREQIDNPSDFLQIEVNTPVTLTTEQLLGSYGDIVEILVKSGQAKIIKY